MNFIVGILMAVRSLTFMASFVSVDSSAVSFTEPQIILSEQEAKIKIGLKNALTGELLKLASSGTTIPLYIYVDLMKENAKDPFYRTIVEIELNYDFPSKHYNIRRTSSKDTLHVSTLDSAVQTACFFPPFTIFPINILDRNESYHINIYAILGKTTVEALGNNNMDLMYYWDFKRPSIKTEKYKGESFIIKKS
jgi:hypothetical protein